ncbi:MAG: hypothetical protein AAB353_03085, partial [Candidatus Hydrogenedentota bacterium]
MRAIYGFIRFIQFLAKCTLPIAAGAAAAGLYFYTVGGLYDLVVGYIPQTGNDDLVREIGAGVIIGLAAFALLPSFPEWKRRRDITFSGSHGEVTIDLDPVQATLDKVIGKLPEVKSIRIELDPKDPKTGLGGVRVNARAVLYKEGDGDARVVTARVNSFILAHTRKILGTQEVDVRLRVMRWVMKMRTVKAEPLLLEAPEAPLQPSYAAATAPIAAAVAVAVQPIRSVQAPAFEKELKVEEVYELDNDDASEPEGLDSEFEEHADDANTDGPSYEPTPPEDTP